MKFNKHIAIVGILALFFITRLYNLTLLPIFVDEGLHLSRALQIAKSGDFLEIINGNGKYLPIWLYSFFLPYLPDPLWAGRFFSVLSSLAVIAGLIWLGNNLFTGETGLMAAFLYVITPYTLFHDRMALVDTMLAALLMLTIIASVRWFRTGQWGWGVLTGVVIGCAAITKLYGGLLIVIPIATIFFLVKHNRWTCLKKSVWIIFVILPVLWPIFTDIPKHLELFTDKSGVIAPENTLSLISRNSLSVVEWFTAYFTPVGFVLVVTAVLLAAFQPKRASRLLLLLTIIWTGFFVIISKDAWYPRYLIPIIPLILLMVAQSIITFANYLAARIQRPMISSILPLSVAIILTIAGLQFYTTILTNPVATPLPAIDRWQYIEGWPAGYGVREVVAYLHQQARLEGQMIIIRDNSHGALKEGMNLTLGQNEKLLILVSLNFNNIDNNQAIDGIRNQSRPVYLVIDKETDAPLNFDFEEQIILEPAAVFPKPGNSQQIEIYRVLLP